MGFYLEFRSFLKIHKNHLDYTGSPVIGQFTVKNWTQKIDFVLGSSTKRVLRIKIDFYHIFLSSSFLHGDLPANYSDEHPEPSHQNYLTGDSRHELIITVNITSMMVLASIYLSVSTSLPSTPNIKPVETWLLVNLAYPFLVILVNIVLQVSVYKVVLSAAKNV